jgi:hypothetical protein
VEGGAQNVFFGNKKWIFGLGPRLQFPFVNERLFRVSTDRLRICNLLIDNIIIINIILSIDSFSHCTIGSCGRNHPKTKKCHDAEKNGLFFVSPIHSA